MGVYGYRLWFGVDAFVLCIVVFYLIDAVCVLDFWYLLLLSVGVTCCWFWVGCWFVVWSCRFDAVFVLVLVIGFVAASFCLDYSLCCLIWCCLCFAVVVWFAVLWILFGRVNGGCCGLRLGVYAWKWWVGGFGVVCGLSLGCLCFIVTISLCLIVLLSYFCH